MLQREQGNLSSLAVTTASFPRKGPRQKGIQSVPVEMQFLPESKGLLKLGYLALAKVADSSQLSSDIV